MRKLPSRSPLNQTQSSGLTTCRRGTTDASGKLSVAKVSAGRHSVRVRANGFKETVTPLLPGRRVLDVKLVRTTDEAELPFQEAETAREKARDDAALEKAADLYRQAIKLRPAFPAAQVGLARVLMDLNQFKDAHAAIDAARRAKPSFAEASAVEGRIYREAGLQRRCSSFFSASNQRGWWHSARSSRRTRARAGR